MIRTTSSSSSSKNGEESDTQNLKKMKLDSEPHLSGAYIRNLVKELTSSRTKDSSQTSDISKHEFSQKQEKRKVRRRVQSRKPSQEKLLNMAEARREIVHALKLHREAMKQKQQIKSGPEFHPIQPVSHQFYSPYNSWPVLGNLDFVLPRQTLGLNLNLQDFYNSNSSASSSSSSPLFSSAAEETIHTAAVPPDMAAEFEWNLEGERDGDFVSSPTPFDEVMEFPGWLNANDDLWFNDYFRDYDLPCMDIEEIEGVDGDWLA